MSPLSIRQDGEVSMEPIYNSLLRDYPGLKILVFSGNDDAICSTLGKLLFPCIIFTVLFHTRLFLL
jgi:hypothetical protein